MTSSLPDERALVLLLLVGVEVPRPRGPNGKPHLLVVVVVVVAVLVEVLGGVLVGKQYYLGKIIVLLLVLLLPTSRLPACWGEEEEE